jgi:predicted enzyme related to lactoylglutathione lyase
MFQGLRTVIYHVPDLAKAKAWYATAFGIQPYFDEPFYVGFSVGGYELGLHPDTSGVTFGNNAVAYWGVPKIEDAIAHMTASGATLRAEPMDVGEGIKVGAVADPWGNVIGIIENPHFRVTAGD